MIEFQKLLKEQTSVKVALNGGSEELNVATIPFTLGLSPSMAEKAPTHVLVIDLPYNLYKDGHTDSDDADAISDAKDRLSTSGERRIYELNKINFIQFHKAGKHNLIFILYRGMGRATKKIILQKSNRSFYETAINLDTMVARTETNSDWHTVGYCEELIDIPTQFFAERPESGFKKVWYEWVNRWHLTDPIDKCDFRSRIPVSVTIKPIVWILGFLYRLVVSIVASLFMVTISLLFFLSGQQPRSITRDIGILYWDFMFLYPKEKLKYFVSYNLNELTIRSKMSKYKHYSYFGKEFKILISPMGLLIQTTLWSLVIFSIWLLFLPLKKEDALGIISLLLATNFLFITGAVFHLSYVIRTTPHPKVKSWFEKHFIKHRKVNIGKIWSIVFKLLLIPTACLLYTNVPWTRLKDFGPTLMQVLAYMIPIAFLIVYWKKTRKAIIWIFSKFIDLLMWVPKPKFAIQEKSGETIIVDGIVRKKKLTRTEWLIENMHIDNLPEKVNLKEVVAQTKTETFVQKFKISFWSAKSKVCKPYSK